MFALPVDLVATIYGHFGLELIYVTSLPLLHENVDT